MKTPAAMNKELCDVLEMNNRYQIYLNTTKIHIRCISWKYERSVQLMMAQQLTDELKNTFKNKETSVHLIIFSTEMGKNAGKKATTSQYYLNYFN